MIKRDDRLLINLFPLNRQIIEIFYRKKETSQKRNLCKFEFLFVFQVKHGTLINEIV